VAIFTAEELEQMKDAAWALSEIVRDLEKAVRAGVTTAFVDKAAAELVEQYGVRAAFRGYRGYPASTTTSVNEEVIDGVPGPRVLRDGDALKLQLGIESDGLHCYWANTYAIGGVEERVARQIEATRRAVAAAVRHCRPGELVEEVSRAIQQAVEGAGLEVVRQYCGHGIGRRMHEEPQIPCYVDQRLAGRYRLSVREVVAIQVLTLEKPARLASVGSTLTVAAPKGVFSAHLGAVVAVGDPPEVLVAPRELKIE
jgi:methionyl aminopeptidase